MVGKGLMYIITAAGIIFCACKVETQSTWLKSLCVYCVIPHLDPVGYTQYWIVVLKGLLAGKET